MIILRHYPEVLFRFFLMLVGKRQQEFGGFADQRMNFLKIVHPIYEDVELSGFVKIRETGINGKTGTSPPCPLPND